MPFKVNILQLLPVFPAALLVMLPVFSIKINITILAVLLPFTALYMKKEFSAAMAFVRAKLKPRAS